MTKLRSLAFAALAVLLATAAASVASMNQASSSPTPVTEIGSVPQTHGDAADLFRRPIHIPCECAWGVEAQQCAEGLTCNAQPFNSCGQCVVPQG